MAATNGLPEDPALLRARLVEVEARYAQSQVQFRELRTWYDKLKRQHRELLWSEAVLAREGLEEAMPGPPIADADRANGHIGGGFVLRHHLGAGAFATVYAAIDKEGRPCAVKRIDKYHIKSLESLRNVAGELRALRAAVGCPNLVWVRGVVASETYLSFVMELFGTSNLQEAGAALLAPLLADLYAGMGLPWDYLSYPFVPVNRFTWRELARQALTMSASKELAMDPTETPVVVRGVGWEPKVTKEDAAAMRLAAMRLVDRANTARTPPVPSEVRATATRNRSTTTST